MNGPKKPILGLALLATPKVPDAPLPGLTPSEQCLVLTYRKTDNDGKEYIDTVAAAVSAPTERQAPILRLIGRAI